MVNLIIMSSRITGALFICLFMSSVLILPVTASTQETGNLSPVLKIIQNCRFVDLTHSFEPGIPHWKGSPDEKIDTIYSYDPGNGTLGSGFYMQYFSHTGQWGTHVDPPAHFVKGLRTLDQISLKEMILPLVFILGEDVRFKRILISGHNKTGIRVRCFVS